MIKNSTSGYGLVAIAFHWSMAAMILGMIALGVYMHELPKTDVATFELYQLHKSVGFVILLLAILRLGWRAFNPSPALPENLKAWEKALARLGHAGLYAIMFALPLTGWAMVSASQFGIPTIIFNTFDIPHLPIPETLVSKADVEAAFRAIHEYLAWFTMALVVGHVAAALKHHFILKDTVLRRMLSTASARGLKTSQFER